MHSFVVHRKRERKKERERENIAKIDTCQIALIAEEKEQFWNRKVKGFEESTAWPPVIFNLS